MRQHLVRTKINSFECECVDGKWADIYLNATHHRKKLTCGKSQKFILPKRYDILAREAYIAKVYSALGTLGDSRVSSH